MLLPVVLLTVLGCTVFLLPVESGEKNGFALTILLSLSVMLTIVAAEIPTTSTHTSILSVYLLTTYTLCAVEVLLTALTVRWHTCEADGYTLHPTLQRLMKTRLAPLVKYKRADEMHAPDTDTETIDKGNAQAVETKGELEGGNSPLAWAASEDPPKKYMADYGYRDFAIVFDAINFYLSVILTFLINVIFFIILIA